MLIPFKVTLYQRQPFILNDLIFPQELLTICRNALSLLMMSLLSLFIIKYILFVIITVKIYIFVVFLYILLVYISKQFF